jgi:hypothetical protein
MCCGTTTGPFVDLSVPFIKVATALGVMDAEGGTYLCVGRAETPGCAVQIGRVTGLVVDIAAAEELLVSLSDARSESASLREQMKLKTLTVGDLVEAGFVRDPALV